MWWNNMSEILEISKLWYVFPFTLLLGICVILFLLCNMVCSNYVIDLFFSFIVEGGLSFLEFTNLVADVFIICNSVNWSIGFIWCVIWLIFNSDFVYFFKKIYPWVSKKRFGALWNRQKQMLGTVLARYERNTNH